VKVVGVIARLVANAELRALTPVTGIMAHLGRRRVGNTGRIPERADALRRFQMSNPIERAFDD